MESPHISDEDSPGSGPAKSQHKGKKRVVEDDGSKSNKKKRKRQNPKENTIDRDDIDEEHNTNRTIASMDGDLLADLFDRQTKRFEPKLSIVELEDRHIPGSAFIDTSVWSKPRSVENLPAFLERFSSKSNNELSAAPARNGAPHTIVITASGIRAADLTRALRSYQNGEGKLAKLFAKHIKLRDACTFLENTRINIAVGTPQRLIDASEAGALSLEHVSYVIIDGSHVDEKRRGLLDIRDTEVPTVKFLGLGAIKRRLQGGGVFKRARDGSSKQGDASSEQQVHLMVF